MDEALQAEVVGETLDAGGTSTAPLARFDETSSCVTTFPSKALSKADFHALEDKILTQALETVDDSLKWAEIDGDEVDPPKEWVDELGEKRAKQRLRVAKAALLCAKEAPVGLGMARTTAVGIMKVRAAVKMGTPVLNVNVVNFPQPSVALEVIDISGEE